MARLVECERLGRPRTRGSDAGERFAHMIETVFGLALFGALAPVAHWRGYRATYPQLSRTVLAPAKVGANLHA